MSEFPHLLSPRFLAPLLRAIWGVSLAMAAMHASAQAPQHPSEYGKKMVAEYDLSSQQIAKFAAFKPSAPNPQESTLINALLADTEDWVGDVLKTDAASNPYTLVVTLTGKARADGDVTTLWQSGWQMEDGVKKLQAFPGLSKSGMKAGERLIITKASSPSHFTESKEVSPVLGLMNARNFEFESVKAQLWSGIGVPTKTEKFFSYYWLLAGLVMLVLFWWFRRA